jgi:D-glycero-alpha-D-manno-heptose-7-phosphate kinase
MYRNRLMLEPRVMWEMCNCTVILVSEVHMTVIARAPLRIGLAGGGTDLPAYADQYQGLVLSTTIDRYVYVILTRTSQSSLQIMAADANSMLSRRDHLFDSALFWGADYRLPLEVLDYFGVTGGRRVFIASEVPPGTGLGSSSATAVALIRALDADLTLRLSTKEIADVACHIEIDRMGMPIGKQDQYAAAFGGLNILTFTADSTQVNPLKIPELYRRELESRILLFFTGRRRKSTDILESQKKATMESGSPTLESLHEIKRLAIEMIDAIQGGDFDSVGRILDSSWRQKRRLAAGVSTPEIDTWYEEARKVGALGGKITGAGGGGFLMLYADPDQRPAVIQRMSELGLVWVDSSFDRQGAIPLLAVPNDDLVYAD